MDRNSTIGLVLIGLIITVFSVMNQPSEAEIKAAQKKEATQQKAAASKVKAKKEAAVAPIPATANSLVVKNIGSDLPKKERSSSESKFK